MRQIVLDTETTGLYAKNGDRVVEIGCVELVDRKPTGRRLHRYLNPEREVPIEAQRIHGLTDEFLADKPKFCDIAAELADFIRDAELVIHNAAFDMKFLNHELERAGLPGLPFARATDTLMIARTKFPGSPASLDALCRRFGIDNSMREKHGALLDSEILAEVYLELIGGRQPGLVLSSAAPAPVKGVTGDTAWRPRPRPEPLAPRITPEEAAAHEEMVAKLGDAAIWRKEG